MDGWMDGWMDGHIMLSSDFFVGVFWFGHSVLDLLQPSSSKGGFFFCLGQQCLYGFTAPPGTFSKVSMFSRGVIKSTNQPRLLGPCFIRQRRPKRKKKKKKLAFDLTVKGTRITKGICQNT